jgi:hypothetical protein
MKNTKREGVKAHMAITRLRGALAETERLAKQEYGLGLAVLGSQQMTKIYHPMAV